MIASSPGSMSRMTMFAPRASMVYEIPTGRPPVDLLPPEEPTMYTPSKVKRMFRSSMEHMKKVPHLSQTGHHMKHLSDCPNNSSTTSIAF